LWQVGDREPVGSVRIARINLGDGQVGKKRNFLPFLPRSAARAPVADQDNCNKQVGEGKTTFTQMLIH